MVYKTSTVTVYCDECGTPVATVEIVGERGAAQVRDDTRIHFSSWENSATATFRCLDCGGEGGGDDE